MRTRNHFRDYLPTVALVLVLAIFLIPLLKTFKERYEVAEGISMLDSYKERMISYYVDTGSWPQTLSEVTGQSEFKAPGFTIQARDGILEVEYGDKAVIELRGKRIDVIPYIQQDGSVIWQCGTAIIPLVGKFDTVNHTNVPAQYLPGSCRA